MTEDQWLERLAAAVAKEPAKTGMAKVLDVVERVGNKVPHPVVIFVLLIVLVIVLSHIFYLHGLERHLRGDQPRDPRARDPDGRRPQPAVG